MTYSMTPGNSPSTSTRNIQNRRGGNTPKKYRDRNGNTPSPKPRNGYYTTPTSAGASPRTTTDVQNNNRGWSCINNSPNSQSPKQSTMTNSNNESPYAGAKFNDPPSPKLLPKPPTHWLESMKTKRPPSANSDLCNGINECDVMTCQLKMILKVTA